MSQVPRGWFRGNNVPDDRQFQPGARAAADRVVALRRSSRRTRSPNRRASVALWGRPHTDIRPGLAYARDEDGDPDGIQNAERSGRS